MISAALTITILVVAANPAADPARPFAIEVVDDQTGRGVPLIELRTVNGIRLITDSNGIAAFRDPGFFGRSVFFHVQGHGYEFPRDGFGFRGKALPVLPGEAARLSIRRINIAERLYRVTGEGIYADSVLVGRPVPIRHPLLNAEVLGSDSVVNAVYRGKIHWFWGDTNRARYPLGNFQVPGATSLRPDEGGLDPERGVDLDYVVGDDGFARPTAQMRGDGPTWIDGLVVLRDPSGRERMFAAYVKVRNLLDVYEHGLVEYHDEERRFEKVTTFPNSSPIYPEGHPFLRTVDGVQSIHFATPYPLTRVRADPDLLPHLDRYEAFTCLVEGSRPDAPRVDRLEDGAPRYAWKANTPAVGPEVQAKLVRAGLMKPEEGLLQLRDVESGKGVSAHRGSVYWNEYRKRWVLIAVEQMGTSFLGEVWFAEADTPLGPWVYARKVVTHVKYSFYNPKQHPMLARDGGRLIFFEGTYSQTFSGNPEATPRYDYNQIMYRLDLSDSRLNLPVAIYRRDDEGVFGSARRVDAKTRGARAAFFALERPGRGTIPVFLAKGTHGPVLRTADPPEPDASPPLFHALPADRKEAPATTILLHEYLDPEGRSVYATETPRGALGARRSERPICLVWKNPVQVDLPPE